MAKYKEEVTTYEKFTKFNVFGDDGINHIMKSEKPMTTEEALYHWKWALCVGGIE